MIHKAWSSIEEMPYCFARSSVKFQGRTALKIVEFDPDWAFPDCNWSLNSPMATKWCTKLEVAYMLMYLDHLQNWLVYGHSLLIFLILALFWLGFPVISWRTHGGNGLKFCMLMYLDHLQNWLDFGLGLLNFVILALFWLSETGQIWGFRAFPGEPMEEMAWDLAYWCILTTFTID